MTAALLGFANVLSYLSTAIKGATSEFRRGMVRLLSGAIAPAGYAYTNTVRIRFFDDTPLIAKTR
ncbi:hypothetical protein [Nostoc sp.]|uniref:hypothetical protein n=1 Tax=Nostoc sp. TaxID=1180 RepID=UPI002FFD2FB4